MKQESATELQLGKSNLLLPATTLHAVTRSEKVIESHGQNTLVTRHSRSGYSSLVPKKSKSLIIYPIQVTFKIVDDLTARTLPGTNFNSGLGSAPSLIELDTGVSGSTSVASNIDKSEAASPLNHDSGQLLTFDLPKRDHPSSRSIKLVEFMLKDEERGSEVFTHVESLDFVLRSPAEAIANQIRQKLALEDEYYAFLYAQIRKPGL